METNLHKFQAFTSAAYHSSFTVAAEELGCTQSSISRMVASLEKEWDVRLFNRHGGYVSLTPEGKTLLPVAEEVCQAYSKLSNQVNRVSAIEMGNLVIAAPSSFLSRTLPSHLKKYMTDHPNIKVEVNPCSVARVIVKLISTLPLLIRRRDLLQLYLIMMRLLLFLKRDITRRTLRQFLLSVLLKSPLLLILRRLLCFRSNSKTHA